MFERVGHRTGPAACVLVATILGFLGGLTAAEVEDFSYIPPDRLALIEKAEEAFLAQDAAAIGPYLAADYSWYQVSEEGAKMMIKGRDETVALLSGFFGNNDWRDSQVQRLGMLDNILIQVELDHFGEGAQARTIRSLNIYEFRNGERWREWKFYPLPETG